MEMVQLLSVVAAYAVFATGVFVIAFGRWCKMRLKFAGVALSTSAAFALILLDSAYGGAVEPSQLKPLGNFSAELYHLVRSLAFIAFHIAVGRDAIRFKNCDRRGSRWMRKS